METLTLNRKKKLRYRLVMMCGQLTFAYKTKRYCITNYTFFFFFCYVKRYEKKYTKINKKPPTVFFIPTHI